MCFDPATKKTSYQRFILQFAIDIVLVNERNIKLNEISFFFLKTKLILIIQNCLRSFSKDINQPFFILPKPTFY